MSWPVPPMGGAEAFFERLAARPARGGRGGAGGDPARMPGARRGCGPPGSIRCELPFGGPLDLRTGPRLCAARWRLRPGGGGRLGQPRRPASPARPGGATARLDAGGPAGRLLRASNTTAIATTWSAIRATSGTGSSRQGWPAERAHFVPNFAHGLRRRGARRAAGAAGRAAAARARPAASATRASTCCCGRWRCCRGAHLSLAGEGPERAALEAAGAGAWGGGSRGLPRLAAGCRGAAGGLRRLRLPVPPRAAGQCGAGSLVRRAAGRRRRGAGPGAS